MMRDQITEIIANSNNYNNSNNCSYIVPILFQNCSNIVPILFQNISNNVLIIAIKYCSKTLYWNMADIQHRIIEIFVVIKPNPRGKDK